MPLQTLLISYTVFQTISPVQGAEYLDVPFAALVQHLREVPTYINKSDCPLMSLCTYGKTLSAGGCIRHAANVVQAYGAELDYDAGVMPLNIAAQLLESANVRSVLYTSPSHTPLKPRWRAFLPFAAGTAPDRRAEHLARANRVLGGVASIESFTLSQSFYVGRVRGVKYEVVETLGLCIDEHPEIVPLFSAEHDEQGKRRRDATTDEELRARFLLGEGRYEAMQKLAARWAARGMAQEDIERNLEALLGQSRAVNADGIDLHSRIKPLASSAYRKFGETRRPGGGPAEWDLSLGRGTKVCTVPPYWEIPVNGKRIKFSATDLQRQSHFQRLCMEHLDVLPPTLPAVQWSTTVNQMMTDCDVEAAPDDASTGGELWFYLQQFCTVEPQGETKEELLLGLPYTEDGITIFQAAYFKKYLANKKFHGPCDGPALYAELRTLGLRSKQFWVKNSNVRVWFVNAFDEPVPDVPPRKPNEEGAM